MRNHWLDEWEAQQENHEEEFNERAAIMQYEADMSKQDAEKQAMKIIEKKYPNLIFPSIRNCHE